MLQGRGGVETNIRHRVLGCRQDDCSGGGGQAPQGLGGRAPYSVPQPFAEPFAEGSFGAPTTFGAPFRGSASDAAPGYGGMPSWGGSGSGGAPRTASQELQQPRREQQSAGSREQPPIPGFGGMLGAGWGRAPQQQESPFMKNPW